MDNSTEKFSFYQTINTTGGTDMEYFTIADTHYLAVVKFESASARQEKVVIYQWKRQFFVVFQIILEEFYRYPLRQHRHLDFKYGRGDRKADLNFMKIGSEQFLTIVYWYRNRYNHHWIEIETYKWINNAFDTSPGGFGIRTFVAYHNGATTEFVIKNETFIVITTGNKLYVYKWLRGRFDFLPVRHTQLKYGARDVKSFKMNGQIFLAIANFEDGTKSNILRWNGSEFVPYQSLFNTEAIAWHPFVMYSQTFLGVVDAYGQSFVYRAIGSRFFKYQELSTQGSHGMTSFVQGGHTYLVVANTISTVYKFK